MFQSFKIFVLTDEWYDYSGKNVLRFYGISDDGAAGVIIDNFPPVFFIKSATAPFDFNMGTLRKKVNMKTFAGDEVDAVYFKTQTDLRKACEKLSEIAVNTYESDIDPARRYLMERDINACMLVTGEFAYKNGVKIFHNPKVEPCEYQPEFTCASIDIETGNKNTELYSIAVHLTGKREEKIVFMTGKISGEIPGYLKLFLSESELLKSFIRWFKEADPDIIIGWHIIGFDLMFLEEKCKALNINFDIARSNGRVSLRTVKGRGNYASIRGRVVIDGPPALRAAFYSFEDYKLETVAQKLLKTGKTITSAQNKVEEIEKYYNEEKVKLAQYNLNDAVLVSDIFRKTGLVELSVKRSMLSGLLMDRLGMMTAAFDHFYLPKLHKAGYAAPNIKDLNTSEHAAGGYVMDPVPGIYEDVVVLDFKSLYPSIIQTFKIDPVSRIESYKDNIKTPNGFNFSATSHYLPDFIAALMQKRSEAKISGDKYLSQAIKILMNSFYGVMGSYGCRFYHPDLPTAITGTGQWLLLGSKNFLESDGYHVIYGDTDSLFVQLKKGEGINADEAGVRIAGELNTYWKKRLNEEYKVTSYLEIEYEKYYRKFIITPARGGDMGAKKRYAGMKLGKHGEEIEFVGMEYVRSDWTRLAKEFQVELYSKIFNGNEIEDWIRSVVSEVKAGTHDAKLVYTKRIRKDVEDYKNLPPQVRAAKMLSEAGSVIQYLVTKKGPVPVELEPSSSSIDYNHYIEKQLKPIADSVLCLIGTSFEQIAESRQLNIFD